jgi:hypothetical protein
MACAWTGANQRDLTSSPVFGRLPFDQVAPVRSEKPLLLISGAYDPITPPVYGESLLAQFPAAQHVVFPGGTHGQVVTNMCANALVASFLDEPTSQVETSCIPASAPEVVTQDDVVFLGVLNRSIAQSGIMGLAQAGMAQIPAIILGLLLVVASLVYPVVWIIRLAAGWRLPAGSAGHRLA